jgi:rhamnosyltransferase
MMSKKVCVLLSTYNGEAYLREQIDSILAQIDVSVELIIRDDGSKDSTVKIINEYKNQYVNVLILDSYKNLGPANSFMELLYASGDADYYAFAEQDDIWLPEKLSKAIGIIEHKNIDGSSSPVLYASNQILYYGDKFYLFRQLFACKTC